MRCFYDTEPAPKKPRVKKVLTDEEKKEASVHQTRDEQNSEGQEGEMGGYLEALERGRDADASVRHIGTPQCNPGFLSNDTEILNLSGDV